MLFYIVVVGGKEKEEKLEWEKKSKSVLLHESHK